MNQGKLPVLTKASEWLTLALNELDSHSWTTAPEALADHEPVFKAHPQS